MTRLCPCLSLRQHRLLAGSGGSILCGVTTVDIVHDGVEILQAAVTRLCNYNQLSDRDHYDVLWLLDVLAVLSCRGTDIEVTDSSEASRHLKVS